MGAQRLLDAAPFAPDIVKLLKQVFDEAWASIALTTAAERASNTRLSLAHAIVAHAASGERDFDALKTAALEAIQSHPPQADG
jgi:hypothetical protein